MRFVNGNELYWAKLNPNAVIPTKEDEDAGYDIYACFDKDALLIPAHQTVLVPSGIAVAMSSDYYMQLKERGSTGSIGMKVSAGVIDSGYRGEIFVALTNTNDKDIIISKKCHKVSVENGYIEYPYSKAVAQGVIARVYPMVEYEINYRELSSIPSLRGTKNLGSSGK